MPHPRARVLPGLVAAALAAALLATSGVLPAGQAGAAGPAIAAGPAAATDGAPRAMRLLLITGDRLVAAPGPAGTAVVEPRAGAHAISVLSDFGCSRNLKIPFDALPYLGRGLDPDLFQITALEGAERGGRLPVRLSYQGTLPRLPGVTITRAGGGTADGYLTPASARAFGAALRRQFAGDHNRGRYGTEGLFARDLTIGLAGRSLPQRERPKPSFALGTLTVTGSDLAGKPDTGDNVLVFNLDNCAKLDPLSSFATFQRGAVRLSVPTGNYWAVALFNHGSRSTDRLVVLPQFTVGRRSTVHVSERQATSKITVTTPRPTLLSAFFTLLRANHGATEGVSVAGGPLRVSPVTRPPSIGGLHAYTQATASSPGGLKQAHPYAYMLDFPAPPGIIPANLHYTARPAGLATIHERFYQDVKLTGVTPAGLGIWAMVGGTPAEIAAGLGADAVSSQPMPGRLTQYVSTGAGVRWQGFDWTWGLVAETFGTWRRYHAGQQVTGNWNRYPLHPTPDAPFAIGSTGLFPVLPSASRAGNTLTLDVVPFGDNQPGDGGLGFGSCNRLCHGRYALYQNGKKLAGGDAGQASGGAPDLFLRAKLAPKPSVVKFVLTASRASQAYLLSPASTDVWTWRSRPEPAATVPAPWSCRVTTGLKPPDYDPHCAVQDMTTLRYHVAGLNLSGVTKPGRQQVLITASQIKFAPAVPIAQAGVQVSFDGGRSWHPARVSKLSSGRFRAEFSAPAGSKVTLRTHATGAAGVSVTETIQDAYRVASR
jgi:hypothetical protein